ncbi:MAG: tape measure protein [Chitinophagaceae bacterium]|nr:tape measure protein [Chitinophagaceae bacterium]
MLQGLEYILKLQDQLSPAFMKAVGVADSAAARIQADMNKVTGSTNSFKYSINDLKSRLDSLNATRLSTHLPDVFKTATREAQKLERQIERIEGKGKNGPGGMSIGGLLGGAALLAGGGASFNTGVQQQSIARAINFTTGGNGAEAMSHLKSQSNLLGLDEAAMQQGFKTLSGGLRGLNFDLKEQQQIMGGVNKGIATFGLQGEESKRVYLALGQIASKGTVQAEELRGQIGEVVPGAFSIAAKAMGVTEQQLNKMMDTGNLMSKDFLPKFAMQMEKEFGQSAIDASSGAAANMNRFKNVLLQVKTVVGEELLPPIISVFSAIGKGIEWIVQHKDFMFPIITAIGSLILITQGWAAAQQFVNTVMKLNPIILIISLIIGLIYWIYNIIKANKNWGESLKAIWEITKSVFGLLWVPVKMFWEDLSYWFQKAWFTIKDWGETVWQYMKNLWTGIKTFFTDGWDAAKAAVNAPIETEASKQLMALEKEHGATKTAQAKELVGHIKNISDNYTKIDFSVNKGEAVKAGGVNAIGANADGKMQGLGSGIGSKISDAAKSKADGVNSGGQRNITININKQVGAEQIHVMSGADAANNIESLVREAMRRMLLSLNGNAVANA